VEGGWPKDINRLDEEQTARYRKKQEKDEAYLSQMKGLIKACEHAIYQNNAVNLYETYFEDMEQIDLKDEYTCKTLNMYRDKTKRGVRKIIWCPDDPTHFTSTHCGKQTYFCYLVDEPNTLNIWDIEFPKAPIRILDAHSQSQCLEYNPKEPTSLVTGMITGQAAYFDIRSDSQYPAIISRRENSHRDKVNAVTFYCSKTNMEFFSGSSFGEIFWWDLRNLEKPIDTLLLSPIAMADGIAKNEEKAFGVLALEYESTIPNKYMVGTDHGVVYICNKRFKTPADRIYSKVQCCNGIISAVQRNPSFLKFFLSVGDWQAKIWCEELKDSPIFWTKEYTSELVYGCWNTVRCSSFYLCRMDGVFDAWDVIHRSERPVLSTKVLNLEISIL
jgi:dynein intermediate chain 2, axonemal